MSDVRSLKRGSLILPMKNLLHLFITCYLLLLLLNRINAQDIKFEHISVEDGLSHGTVFCIIQDSQGFMWFGTADGLNKYDGYKLTVYRHDPADSSTLSSNRIRDIYEDHSGTLWIATAGGGGAFPRAVGQVVAVVHGPAAPHDLDAGRMVRRDSGVHCRGRISRVGDGAETVDFDTHVPTEPLPAE